MQFRTTGLLLLGAMALPASGTAQTTPAPPAITRTVVAAAKLPTVTDAPLHFKAVSITLQPDEKSGVSAAQRHPLPGVRIDRGLARWRGQNAQRRTGAVHRRRAAERRQLFSTSSLCLGRPVEAAPAAVRELYRTASPIPDLKPGGYDHTS